MHLGGIRGGYARTPSFIVRPIGLIETQDGFDPVRGETLGRLVEPGDLVWRITP